MSVVVEPMSTNSASPASARPTGRRRMPVGRGHLDRPFEPAAARREKASPPGIDRDSSPAGQCGRSREQAADAGARVGENVGQLAGHRDRMPVGAGARAAVAREGCVQPVEPLPQRHGDRLQQRRSCPLRPRATFRWAPPMSKPTTRSFLSPASSGFHAGAAGARGSSLAYHSRSRLERRRGGAGGAGDRDLYRPIVTPLSAGRRSGRRRRAGCAALAPVLAPSTSPISTPSRAAPRMRARSSTARTRWPMPPDIWLDAGFADEASLAAALDLAGVSAGARLGIAARRRPRRAPSRRSAVILSLDFFADGFRGPADILASRRSGRHASS